MEKQKIKEQLVMRRLGLEHLDQFNRLLRYVFQVTNEDLQKGGYEDGELIRSKLPLLERSNVFGWFKDERLISQVCMYPCTVNIHGRLCPMAGLTGVGTYPEYSGLGLMNDLIRAALDDMRAQGQLISYLYPYIIPFYRRKGWEILSDQISFTIKDNQLPKIVDVPGFVERQAVNHPDVILTYDKFARQTHGAMIRGEFDWEEYWRWDNEEEWTAAVYYNSSGEATGHMLYWIHDDIFHIKEMIYLDQEARRGLWNFIGAHYSMIDAVKGNMFKNEPVAFYLEDSQLAETIEPYFMARIVDIRAFLEVFPFIEIPQAFSFRVSDHTAEWNHGVFSVVGTENGKNIVLTEPAGKMVELDIRTLTAMLMNYRRASFFAELEYLSADAESVQLLERIIPNRQPYFSDYF